MFNLLWSSLPGDASPRVATESEAPEWLDRDPHPATPAAVVIDLPRIREILRALAVLCEAGCTVEPTGTGFRCTPPKGVVPFNEAEVDDPHAAIRRYLDRLGVAEPFVFPASAPTAEYEERYAALRARPDVSAIIAAEDEAKFKQILTAGSDRAGN